VRQVHRYRGDDEAGFIRRELYSDHGHADPGVDHNALIEYAVENVNETAVAGGPFNHRAVRVSRSRTEATTRT